MKIRKSLFFTVCLVFFAYGYSNCSAFAIDKLTDNIVSDVEHSGCYVLTLKDSPKDKERIKKVMQKLVHPVSNIPSDNLHFDSDSLLTPLPAVEFQKPNTDFYKPSYKQNFNGYENNRFEVKFKYQSSDVENTQDFNNNKAVLLKNEIRDDILNNQCGINSSASEYPLPVVSPDELYNPFKD